MSEQDPNPEVDQAGESWTWLIQIAAALLLLVASGLLVHYYAPASSSDLQDQVHELNQQVQLLKQEQAMPVMVLNRYRNSICYVFGVYQVGFPSQPARLRARVSGTGFIVANGLMATNRHVSEPWYGDPEADALIRRGATPSLEKLVAFFPGSPTAFELTPMAVSAHSDLAILHVEFSPNNRTLEPLPLAVRSTPPGELVTVIGYPMGVAGMVAKSPTEVYERLAYRHDDMGAASELAALSLIRPSATVGHLGDVVGDKLIYDAPTAHGGSGGPVFNSEGQVIGINSAYIDGFSGGTLGISVDALRPLIEAAQKRVPASDMRVIEVRSRK
ncbi:MAG: serine protease [Terriglobales bacterium]